MMVEENVKKSRERMVDYKFNPTRLYNLLRADDWKGGVEFLKKEPIEASIWISSKKLDDEWTYLPLHMACRAKEAEGNRGSGGGGEEEESSLDALVQALVNAYPDGAQMPDLDGELPIHHALRSGASASILSTLLAANPKSADIVDRNDASPLNTILFGGKSGAVIRALLTRSDDAQHRLQDAQQKVHHFQSREKDVSYELIQVRSERDALDKQRHKLDRRLRTLRKNCQRQSHILREAGLETLDEHNQAQEDDHHHDDDSSDLVESFRDANSKSNPLSSSSAPLPLPPSAPPTKTRDHDATATVTSSTSTGTTTTTNITDGEADIAGGKILDIQLRKDIRVLREQILNLEETNEVLRTTAMQLTREFMEKLKEETTEHERKMADAEAKYWSDREQMLNKLTSANDDKSNALRRCVQLEEQMENIMAEAETTKIQLQYHADRATASEDQLTELRKIGDVMRSDIRGMLDTVKTSREEKQQLLNKVEQLNLDLAQANDQNDSLSKKVESLQKKIDLAQSKRTEYEKQSAKLSTLEKQIAKLPALEKQLDMANTQRAEFEAKIAILKNTDEKDRLNRQMVDLTNELLSAQQDKDKLRSYLNEHETTITELGNRLDAMDLENGRLKEMNESLQKRNTNAEANAELYERLNRTIRQLRSDADDVRQKLLEQTHRGDDLTDQVRNLRTERDILKHATTSLEQQVHVLEERAEREAQFAQSALADAYAKAQDRSPKATTTTTDASSFGGSSGGGGGGSGRPPLGTTDSSSVGSGVLRIVNGKLERAPPGTVVMNSSRGGGGLPPRRRPSNDNMEDDGTIVTVMTGADSGVELGIASSMEIKDEEVPIRSVDFSTS